MINQSSIKYISSLLSRPDAITDGDHSSIALFRQTFPYFVPARYIQAAESHKKAAFSPRMLSEIQPYMGNWILFCNFVEAGRKTTKPGSEPIDRNIRFEQKAPSPILQESKPPAQKLPGYMQQPAANQPKKPEPEKKEAPVPPVVAEAKIEIRKEPEIVKPVAEVKQREPVAPVTAEVKAEIKPAPAKPIEVAAQVPPPVVPPVTEIKATPVAAAEKTDITEVKVTPAEPVVAEVKAEVVAETVKPAAVVTPVPVVVPEVKAASVVPTASVQPKPAPVTAQAPPSKPGAEAEVIPEVVKPVQPESKLVFTGLAPTKVIVKKQIEIAEEVREPKPSAEPEKIVPPAIETIPEEMPDAEKDKLIFPVYTEDYFLQQGLKVSADLPEEIDEFMDVSDEEDEDKSLMVMMSFSEWLLHFKNTSEKQKEEKKDQKALKTMWQKEKLAAAMEEENEEIPENVFEMAVNSIAKEDGLASESLADIYIKQGKYDKAIEMYRKLSLRNPKKNAYFARRIEEVLKEKQS